MASPWYVSNDDDDKNNDDDVDDENDIVQTHRPSHR
jgi:hypothetical protein